MTTLEIQAFIRQKTDAVLLDYVLGHKLFPMISEKTMKNDKSAGLLRAENSHPTKPVFTPEEFANYIAKKLRIR